MAHAPTPPHPAAFWSPRAAAVAFLGASLGLLLHNVADAGARAGLGADAIDVPFSLVAIAALALGLGLAGMESSIRQAGTDARSAWAAGKARMAWALALGACVPAATIGYWPVPSFALAGMAVQHGAPITFGFALASMLMGAAMARVLVGWNAQAHAGRARLWADMAAAAGILGVGTLAGTPFLSAAVWL